MKSSELQDSSIVFVFEDFDKVLDDFRVLPFLAGLPGFRPLFF